MDIEALDQTDWDQKLPSALSAIRTVGNKTTKETPFYVAFGFEARNPADIIRRETKPGAREGMKEWADRLVDLKDLHGRVHARILQEHADRQRREDPNVRFTPFKEGEKVWKKDEGRRRGQSRKLVGHRWKGPYVVRARKVDTTYTIRLEGRGQRESMINHRRLKRHIPRPAHLRSQQDTEHSDEVDTPTSQEFADDGDEGWQLNEDQEEGEETPQQRLGAANKELELANLMVLYY